jgi:2-amino-4-hydroxy-6-hydroxymethyldihydropteridine diphosphokinase
MGMELHERVAAAARGVLPEWACVGPGRRAHIERVAELMRGWAVTAALDDDDVARWSAAGYLHDALREADPEQLRGGLDPEFSSLPGPALHGPAAAARLRAEGVRDEGLLLAVGYHTLGHPQLDRLGRALYAADFLEPGRSSLAEWRGELRDRLPAELDAVTREIVGARVRHLVDRGLPLLAPTVAFWNSLVEPSGGETS